MVWKFQHTEGRLGIVMRLGPNWRNEYFFPVILQSFPVIEIVFPCYHFHRFWPETPMDAGVLTILSVIFPLYLLFSLYFTLMV